MVWKRGPGGNRGESEIATGVQRGGEEEENAVTPLAGGRASERPAAVSVGAKRAAVSVARNL